MARTKYIGLILAFATDFFCTGYLVLGIGGSTSETGTESGLDIGFVLGRLLGLGLLSLLAVRVALGHWPSLRGGSSRELSGFQDPVPATANAAPSQTRLLEEGQPASSEPPPLLRTVTPDGDERARQIDATVADRQAQLKKLERGLVWRNALMLAAYLYMSTCSVWTAVVVVSSDVSTIANVLAAVAHIACIFAMNLEFILLKGIVMEMTAGEPVYMNGMHEHPLYWSDVQGKGYTMCSSCNEKVGMKTGGSYLVLQCRTCEPGRYGFGGFQICMQCYRKNAAKAGAAKDGAGGSGILVGDKGPKIATKLTVLAYVRRLLGLMRGRTIITMLFAVVGCQVLKSYIPKVQGDCINALVKADPDSFNRYVWQFAALVVLSAVMQFAMSASVSILNARLLKDMACSLFNALINQDIAFYDNAMTGQLTSRLSNDLRQAVSPVSIIINSFLANIIMLVAGVAICFQASWRLTILAFTFLTPLVHITSEFSKWASKLMATQYTYIADAQGSATQALTNIRTVRSFAAQDLELEQYEEHMIKSLRVGITSAWGMGTANLLSGLVQQSASFIILNYGGHLALGHSGFDVGSIITFTMLWNRLSSAFQGLNDNLNQPVKAMSAGQRVFEILDLKPDISDQGGEPFPADLQQVEVKLQDVEFTFQSRPDKQILKTVSLTLDAGQTTAVVGKSGCGKSTISKLLLRFYDPTAGSIYINGRDLREMSLPGLRQKVGIVSQDTQLFRMTVQDNITYGLRPGSFDPLDVERAAKLANADEFIRTLPEGYKTMVGEGGQDLSGGQKQRLSIARALVRRPRVLLLDEATSALDAENEAQVQKALDHLMKEMQGSCTIMVIAHRLSTIKDAYRIIVLHEGIIVEQGTHEELLQIKDGRYAAMISRQLSGGDKEEEDDGEPSEDKTAKAVQQQVISLIEGLPEHKQGEVLMAVMKPFKGAMMRGMKGKGGGR